MRSTKTALVILSLGVLAGLVAIAIVVLSATSFVGSVKSIATVTCPGSTTVQLDEPGSYVLWEDTAVGSTAMSTSTVGSASASSPGPFTRTLTHTATGTQAPFTVSSMSMTRTYGSTQSQGIGTFQVSTPGEYEFAAQHPDNLSAQFSLTAGEFGTSMAKSALGFGGALLLGFASFAGVIIGIVLLLAQKKRAAAPTPPPAQP